MDKKEAYRIIERYSALDNITDKDDFIFIEACNYIIDTEEDKEVMSILGGYYYGKGKYDLAEKYYLLADEHGDKYAPCGLGFIYYYGRIGSRDYKKAFYYYSKSMEYGNKESAMKIADMYHFGYGVDKDDNKYKEIILNLYNEIKDTTNLSDPYPEITHRLADIYINEGYDNKDEIINMLFKAKSFISQRIRYNPFWGNFVVVRRVVSLLYKLIPFDDEFMDIYDLFYLFLKPHVVSFVYHGREYKIESFIDEGEIRIKSNNKIYKNIEDFLINSIYDFKHIYIIEYDGDIHLELLK